MGTKDGSKDGPSHWTATRFAQKPVPQPLYRFAQVPPAERRLEGSVLQRISQREHCTVSMAEMLLLCKEAMRRRRRAAGTQEASPTHTTATAPSPPPHSTKPLSLEYIADRCDVDDPLFGYLVRTARDRPGMLQGFVTVTTFTNWQRTFRWDSASEAAYQADSDLMARQRRAGERKWDVSNQLAQELQRTVRYGDIWAEGVVWPRIAEVSLLGALGCGRTLLELVIEDLECRKPTDNANYDYIVLQATENSIAFYESLGFVRVGAVTDCNEAQINKQLQEQMEEEDSHPQHLLSNHIVTGDVTYFTVKKGGTTLAELAKRHHVDVWDLLFLNRHLYKEITSHSRLMAGTMLLIPQLPHTTSTNTTTNNNNTTAQDSNESGTADAPKYYTAKENDTPRKIAKMFQLNCDDLIDANKARLPGLAPSSRLRQGTKVRVSHLLVPEVVYQPYAHWSFPDDNFEEGEPGYMMARKLNRRRGSAANHRPVLQSLAIPIAEYEQPPLLLFPPETTAISTPMVQSLLIRDDQPKPPRKPMGPYLIFCQEQRQILQTNKETVAGMSMGEISQQIAQLWRDLSDEDKLPYLESAHRAKMEYRHAKASYELAMQQCTTIAKQYNPSHSGFSAAESHDPKESLGRIDLFNAVVKLKPGAITEGSNYTYWYVLTYIPDLQWCHLAPMIPVGVFGPDKPKAEGRVKYMLVDERLGMEVDISAIYCIPIKARFMKKTLDADREEWDVIDDGSIPSERRSRSRVRSKHEDDESSSVSPSDCSRGAENYPALRSLKPKAICKAPQFPSFPPLKACFPWGTGNNTVTVRLKGEGIERRGRGRPKGSITTRGVDNTPVTNVSFDSSPEQIKRGKDGQERSRSSNRRVSLSHEAGVSTKDKCHSSTNSKTEPATPSSIQRSKSNTRRKNDTSRRAQGEVIEALIAPPESILRTPLLIHKCDAGESVSFRKRKSRDTPSDDLDQPHPKRLSRVAYVESGPSKKWKKSQKKQRLTNQTACQSSGMNGSYESPSKRQKTAIPSNLNAARPRRAAAPQFLGEPSPLAKVPEETIPYNPPKRPGSSIGPRNAKVCATISSSKVCAENLSSPRSTPKRWHPIRETRNGKITPRARRTTDPPTERRISPRRSPTNEHHAQVNNSALDSPRPKRKAAPNFSLLETSLLQRSASSQ